MIASDTIISFKSSREQKEGPWVNALATKPEICLIPEPHLMEGEN